MSLITHDHQPLYRVIRAGWPDPLDTSFARAASNRWNRPDSYGVLYTCCSETVARAIALDLYEFGQVAINDLQPAYRPQLAEVGWAGHVVDMASPAGLIACGFSLGYPDGVTHHHTQPVAEAWHALGAEGVLARSASLWRAGERDWLSDHAAWSELAVFVENAKEQPILLHRRADLTWLLAVG